MPTVDERKVLLLVEGDEDQVVLAMHALRKHGIAAEVDEVVAARDGVEALNYLFGTGGYEGRDLSVMRSLYCQTYSYPG